MAVFLSLPFFHSSLEKPNTYIFLGMTSSSPLKKIVFLPPFNHQNVTENYKKFVCDNKKNIESPLSKTIFLYYRCNTSMPSPCEKTEGKVVLGMTADTSPTTGCMRSSLGLRCVRFHPLLSADFSNCYQTF
jgi:hypothetical protein